jgi:hypothetical protein
LYQHEERTAIFPTSQVKRPVVLVVLTLEPVTQQGRSASALVTSRLALFFSVKQNWISIFGSVIDYTGMHSFMVSLLMRMLLFYQGFCLQVVLL